MVSTKGYTLCSDLKLDKLDVTKTTSSAGTFLILLLKHEFGK